MRGSCCRRGRVVVAWTALGAGVGLVGWFGGARRRRRHRWRAAVCVCVVVVVMVVVAVVVVVVVVGVVVARGWRCWW